MEPTYQKLKEKTLAINLQLSHALISGDWKLAEECKILMDDYMDRMIRLKIEEK